VRQLTEKEKEVLMKMRYEEDGKGDEKADAAHSERMKANSARYISGKIHLVEEKDLYQALGEKEIQLSGSVGPPSEILPFVYLCGKLSAAHMDQVPFDDFTHVLMCHNEPTTPYQATVSYLPVNVEDVKNSQICEYVDVAADYIKEAEDSMEPRLVVHCRKGQSRSASLLSAYFIKHRRMTLKETLGFIAERRYICLNEGFFEQLQAYEKVTLGLAEPSVEYPEAHRSTWVTTVLKPKEGSEEEKEKETTEAQSEYQQWRRKAQEQPETAAAERRATVAASASGGGRASGRSTEQDAKRKQLRALYG